MGALESRGYWVRGRSTSGNNRGDVRRESGGGGVLC